MNQLLSIHCLTRRNVFREPNLDRDQWVENHWISRNRLNEASVLRSDPDVMEGELARPHTPLKIMVKHEATSPQ
jgi:hypothetical protein